MTTIDPAYLEHQRWRWMRPDAERFPRPDWRDRKYWIVPPRPVVTSPYDQTLQPADANEGGIGNTADRRGLAEFKRPIAEIRLDLAHLALLRKAYNPHQPRVPAGNPDGGQWTRDIAVSLAQRRTRLRPDRCPPSASVHH